MTLSAPMIAAVQVVTALRNLRVTHVVWLPDSVLGTWESALVAAPDLTLVRVCREGEAWALAAGLYLGGKQPVVVIQNTGLFESGDSLRNALFDWGLPLMAIIGYRSALVPNTKDTAMHFTEPILRAWGIDYVVLRDEDPLETMTDHFLRCAREKRPGVALLPEGRN